MGSGVRDLGEFDLIERLLARLGSPGKGVVIGPGDDAAAVETGPTTLAAADLMVEGVHFEIGLSSPADVGYKALAVNLSDIAAMGGIPRYALVSLGAPASSARATLEAIYDGIAECAGTFEVSVVGGDTVRSEMLIVSVAVTGDVTEAGLVTRGGARPGNVLCVTGTLGGAAAGLELLRAAGNDQRARELLERFPSLRSAHARPMPRVHEGVGAARSGATAMIDISDGLTADAGHVCESSRVGMELREASLPLADGVAEAAAWLGRDPLELAVGGGDDYELAIAVPAAQVTSLARALGRTAVTPVGAFGGDERIVVRRDGTRRELAGLGWDHFGEES